jgi:hypothetical protein
MMVNQIRAKNGIPYDSLSYENALDKNTARAEAA